MTSRPADQGPPDPIAVLTERLAQLLRRGARPGAELEPALGALFAALQAGDTCVPLAAIAATMPADSPLAGVAALRAALLQSGTTSGPDAPAGSAPLPLVLDAHDRLYFLRHRRAEQRVAAALRARAASPLQPAAATLAALRSLRTHDGTVDWQHVAVAAAVRARLTVLIGGPGTGKTTTIQKLLTVLLQGEPGLQVALVAPTGKAAARMGDALQGAFAAGQVPRATTLHRLLGYLAPEDAFRRNAASPLPHDVVVVDEASMVDLELMDALLAALSPHARLLLLGDRDQLASVAAGQVLGDLCGAAPPDAAVGPQLAAFCREHLGLELPVAATPTPFADHLVALRRNWRFAADSGIGAFATALAAGRAGDAYTAATAGHSDLQLVAPGDRDALLLRLLPVLRQPIDAEDHTAALAAQATLRILCAVRHGPFGVTAWNDAVEALLAAHGHPIDAPFYRGRPVLITANDHASNLYNGDLGVAWPDSEDRMLVWFPGHRGGPPRSFLPLRLPPHETAWAITVHKSQGSEFASVVAVLPERKGPLLHAALVYTAVTRARQQATLVADPELLRQALATQPERSSGLLDLLRAAPDPGHRD